MYLQHIGVNSVLTPSFDYLELLHQSHLRKVPFENLTIMSKNKQSDTALSLNIEDIYSKIIDLNQGGFCYELNTIFGWLLEQLGFDVQYLVAQVLLDENYKADPGIMDHMCLLVRLDQRYLVDVGFGKSFISPMNFETEHQDLSGRYRIVQLAEKVDDQYLKIEYNYVLQTLGDEDWNKLYMFSEHPFRPPDFKPSCVWMETSNKSSFTQRIITTKATSNGRITISSDNITIKENGQTSKEEINSSNELRKLLKTHFGIMASESLKNSF